MKKVAMSSVFGSVWILRRGENGLKRGLLGRKSRLKQAR